MLDALGNEIVLGQKYGYARNENGLTFVTVGTAKKMEKRVTLEVELAKKCLYDFPMEPLEDAPKKVTVRSFMLFPVK